jgi:hypothetical protein
LLILSSVKDVEDSSWLLVHHAKEIDWNRLSTLLGSRPEKAIQRILSKIESEFEGNEAVLGRVRKVRKLLKSTTRKG